MLIPLSACSAHGFWGVWTLNALEIFVRLYASCSNTAYLTPKCSIYGPNFNSQMQFIWSKQIRMNQISCPNKPSTQTSLDEQNLNAFEHHCSSLTSISFPGLLPFHDVELFEWNAPSFSLVVFYSSLQIKHTLSLGM